MKRSLSLYLANGLAVFLLCMAAAAAQEKSVADLCAAAGNHVAKSEFDRAVELYSEALARDPDSFDAALGRAGALVQLGEDRRAIVDLDRAISVDPGHAAARRERGLAHERQEELDRALLDLDACLARTPDDALALFARGRVHSTLDHLGQAKADLDRAVQLLPDEAGPLAWRGRTLFHDDRLAEAEADLARVHAMGDAEPWARAYYGCLLWLKDDNESARSVLLQSIAANPEDSWALSVLASVEYELDRPEAGLQHIDAALAIDATVADYHVTRGRILVALGRDTDAEIALARARSLDPELEAWRTEYLEAEDPFLPLLPFLMLVVVLTGVLVVHCIIGLSNRGSVDAAIARIPEKHTRARYDGELGALFALYLKNVVLMLLTLGIYRFWAKVDILRYRYQHTSFAGGRFDYHGTGWEKFSGFLKGLVILAPPVVGFYALYGYLEPDIGEDPAFLVCLWGFILLSYTLRPLILVGSQRFNLARTSFNNLRFHFTGRVGAAYRLYLRDLLIIVATLGIYLSWHQVNVRRFKLAHTRMGAARFDYRGDGGALFGITLAGTLLSYISFGIYLPWYIAKVRRYHVESTYFQKARLRSQLQGIHVAAVCAPALLAVVLSLGLALPWALDRWYRLITETTSYPKAIDLDELQSIHDAGASSTLEGIGEAGEALAEFGDLFGI